MYCPLQDAELITNLLAEELEKRITSNVLINPMFYHSFP